MVYLILLSCCVTFLQVFGGPTLKEINECSGKDACHYSVGANAFAQALCQLVTSV